MFKLPRPKWQRRAQADKPKATKPAKPADTPRANYMDLYAKQIKPAFRDGTHIGTFGSVQTPVLLKPGALMILGQCDFLAVYRREARQRVNGHAEYITTCDIVERKTGAVLAQGCGSCDSEEIAYGRKPAWQLGNIARKRADKRALVQGVIEAVPISDEMTQDLDEASVREATGTEAQASPPSRAAARPKASPPPRLPQQLPPAAQSNKPQSNGASEPAKASQQLVQARQIYESIAKAQSTEQLHKIFAINRAFLHDIHAEDPKVYEAIIEASAKRGDQLAN